MNNSGIDRKFNSGHFDTNLSFQNDAKVRFLNSFKFCLGFSMRRRLRMTYSFQLNLVLSLCFRAIDHENWTIGVVTVALYRKSSENHRE